MPRQDDDRAEDDREDRTDDERAERTETETEDEQPVSVADILLRFHCSHYFTVHV